jgi:hypothetical protein
VTTYYTKNGIRQKNRVGCFAVAIGQIMNYHKHPGSYNWNLLGFTTDILTTQQTAEVSSLLMDIAYAGGTYFDIDGAGSTPHAMEIPTLERFWYDVSYNYVNTGRTGDLIIPEIAASRPVILSGAPSSGETGHIWVVDGTYTFERWYYYWSTTSSLSLPPTDLWRIRYQARLFHCNWGWGGLSNGWYYLYNPKYAPSYTPHPENNYYLFSHDLTIYTGIRPDGSVL